MKQKRVSIRVDDELIEQLKSLAAHERREYSDMIRIILEDAVAEYNNPAKKSPTAPPPPAQEESA